MKERYEELELTIVHFDEGEILMSGDINVGGDEDIPGTEI